jgi:hypothetical protein
MTAGVLGIGCVLLLSGCVLFPLVPQPAPPENDRPPAEGPAGWAVLPHCVGGPNDDWVWVDGFPNEEFDASGATADCGDTWVESDGESFVDVTDLEITTEQLDALGAALEASGYENLFDDFVPGTPAPGEDYYGARDYYLDGIADGDFTRLAIEIYPSHTDPSQWTAYMDFLSPLTRKLS